MNTEPSAMAPEDCRREEAARWRMLLQEDPALVLSPDYLAWTADPANRRLGERADEAWAAFDGLAATPEMIALREEALADVRRAASRRWTARPRIARLAAVAAIGVCLAAGVSIWALSPTVYRTGVGERRVVLLEDGSRLSLDAASEVRVRYSRKGRALELARGQARFDVAKDARRPFVVEAGDRSIIATGTAFNVNLAGTNVCVTLIEGHVVVKGETSAFRRAPAVKPVVLGAGQQLTLAPRGTSVETADLTETTAWERGELIFADEPLAQAVARVNRYSQRRIVVSPGAASVSISGAFHAGETDAFLDAMSSYFQLDAVPGEDGELVLQRRS